MSQFRTSLINRKHVKALLLDTAKATRAHPFTRVGSDTLNDVNEVVRQFCVNKVKSLPSKGKTI